jgi:hypothetical protein
LAAGADIYGVIILEQKRRAAVPGVPRAGVAQELEGVAVPLVRAGFGYHIDLSAAVLAVLCVEIACQEAELGDGIKVGNDGGSGVDHFFDVASIHDEGVGEFALAVDGNRAVIQVAGGRKRAHAAVRKRAAQ